MAPTTHASIAERSRSLRFFSLWSLNAALEEGRLLRQLDGMRQDGFDGVIFHPRFYPDRPPYLGAEYLRILSRVILEARDRGLLFWIYDENGWPSGTVGGKMLRQHPDAAATMLTLHEGHAGDAWHTFSSNGCAMAEVIGGGGWGSRPEDLERFLLWLADHGATELVVHINQYRLSSHAIRDFPPSNPRGVNWREAYAEVLRRVRSGTDAAAAAHAELLVVAPYRGIMAGYEPWSLPRSNIHNCAVYPDTPAGRLNDALLDLIERLPPGHHFADERTLEDQACFAQGRLRVGRHAYTAVLLAEGCRLRARGEERIRQFRAGGGRILTPGDLRPPSARSLGDGRLEPVQETAAIAWRTADPLQNKCLLEPLRDPDGSWTCSFETAAGISEPCLLAFADDVLQAQLDGAALFLDSGEEGTRAALPHLAAGRHTVRFQTAGEDAGPLFVWLRGAFAVLSRSPWTSGPGGHLCTAGPWLVAPLPPTPAGAERVAAGWPFAHDTIVLHGSFALPRALPAAATLALEAVAADALRVRVDGTDAGWVWGPDWTFRLPEPLAQGAHELTLQLAPSTYNRFGPHHHIDGDRFIVSAGQYAGRRNFADRPDAPEFTHDALWRFRPVRPPARIGWPSDSGPAGATSGTAAE